VFVRNIPLATFICVYILYIYIYIYIYIYVYIYIYIICIYIYTHRVLDRREQADVHTSVSKIFDVWQSLLNVLN